MPNTHSPSNTPPLRIISAGAAQGLVKALESTFLASHPKASMLCSFGAVGSMKERFLASLDHSESDNPTCDVMISTPAILDQLQALGHLNATLRIDLGWVQTGLARHGQANCDAALAQRPWSTEQLMDLLNTCSAFYLPDMVHSSAGIHLKKVFQGLGLWESIQDKLKAHPNGAVAMQALAQDPSPTAWGSTQKTEILYTQGVDWMGALPKAFALSTLYQAAWCEKGRQGAGAQDFLNLLAAPEHAALKAQSGFE